MAEKLKITGIWGGVVEVELENCTLSMLKEEISNRSKIGSDSIKLICSGRVLKDGDSDEKLTKLGIKNNSKILVGRVLVEEGKSLKQEFLAVEEHDQRLARVKAAVTALSTRHGEVSFPMGNFSIELEDDNGNELHFSETNRQAIMTGLMLHAMGKGLIRKQKYKDALEVLSMGEEAFSLCDPKSIELVNPFLHIDMVWCYFMLRDIAWLSVAGERLNMAREGLERTHGKDVSCFRFLQSGQSSGFVLNMRLELLIGVVAYHNGEFDKCRRFLVSAQRKFLKFQVTAEALSTVMSMGFTEKEAKRALRMSDQNVESAIKFLVGEKEKKRKRGKDNLCRLAEICEQQRFGETPLKKAVNLSILNTLVSIGLEKKIAAEALRRNENDTNKALHDLINPETYRAIQDEVERKKRERIQSLIKRCKSRGIQGPSVAEAIIRGVLDGTRSVEEVAQQLRTRGRSSNDTTRANIPRQDEEERDVEMEGEIAQEVANEDALSDYDVEVTKEGEAINEYLVLLKSVYGSKIASSLKNSSSLNSV